AIEPQVRDFCVRSLDPLVGSGGFDFILDLGAQMPMKTIGMLLGIPEEDQAALRDEIDAGMTLAQGTMPDASRRQSDVMDGGMYAEYIEWRRDHPSDDLMTDMLNATFVDSDGVERTLTRDEVLAYVGLIAAAGNETT